MIYCLKNNKYFCFLLLGGRTAFITFWTSLVVILATIMTVIALLMGRCYRRMHGLGLLKRKHRLPSRRFKTRQGLLMAKEDIWMGQELRKRKQTTGLPMPHVIVSIFPNILIKRCQLLPKIFKLPFKILNLI
jgi:hypothetical protein